MAEPLRIGVIGCGAIAQIMHIPYMVDYEQFDLVALSDMNRSVLDAVGDRYHIAQRYTDWRELLANDQTEAVALLHSGSHHDTLIEALDANKHVFCEKPLGWTVREAQEVAARAARSDRTVQMGYHKLYDPAFAYAKEQVKQMRDLGLVRITVLHPDNALGLSPYRIRRGNGVIDDGHKEVPPWDQFVQAQIQGASGGMVGPLVDEALGARKGDSRLRLAYGFLVQSVIHQIYTLYGFLGQPSRVLSMEVWRQGMSLHAMIEYPGEVRVTLDYHYLPYLKDYREEYAFFGNHDRVVMQLPSPYLRNAPSPVIVQGGDGELAWEKRIVVSYDEAFRNEILGFCDNVRQHKTPATTIADSVQHAQFIQQLIDAPR